MRKIDFQKEKMRIVDTLLLQYHPEKLIVFGSAARGEIREDSDLDICLIKEDVPESRVQRRYEVYSIMKHRAIPVDVVVYKPSEFKERESMDDPFIKTILKDGQTYGG